MNITREKADNQFLLCFTSQFIFFLSFSFFFFSSLISTLSWCDSATTMDHYHYMSRLVAPVVLLVVLVSVAMADDGICNMTKAGLDSCQPAVTGSPPPDPSQECCQALTAADLPCLCSYKNSVWLPVFGIDPAIAQQLPEKCNLKVPDDC
ncbi:Bifunctional inhibitor/lipid-transfer protein/seed storage 2S albumin protein [Dioscorea alata]|uniref:Bifunctional inhibitor/lipid-transfer protein/seed storage 2S albumin protein n=1 Tax=Dioscorea alata TaxID=55571 RepID=A0ACB7W650_DIOAL|nr:Bifunctional inhibitor/lipid-transfer protein/seed storage 2S albumin protein [Dioscorea alata]